MFSGIVEELGEVREVDGHRMRVGCRTVLADASVGSSIAVDGVCLTVVDLEPDAVAFDLSEETLDRSNLGGLGPGASVNLERPVTLATRLGGHIVQGHVDGIGRVASVTPDGDGATIRIVVPEDLMRYVVEKGSIAVDGVSLTVAGLDGDTVTIALIPHTLAVTTLGRVAPGDPVNLEVDVIAKYVARLTERSPA